MGVWAPLRGNLGFGCDETVLGVSSEMGWGITGLRCSILMACGAFRRGNYVEDEGYLKQLQDIPVIQERQEVGNEEILNEEDEEWDEEEQEEGGRRDRERKVVGDLGAKFEDDNPMRGKVFGGKEMLRKKIYRW
jgi:hypothetical protein